jgi:predicted RNA-binding Zn ribbon-like protein
MTTHQGAPPALAHVFELTGGALCLDFTNTVDNRPTARRRDLLAHYANLVAWSRQSKILSEVEARRLLEVAAARPGRGLAALRRAVRLREALYAVFAAASAHRPPPAAALGLLGGELGRVAPRARLVRDGARFRVEAAAGRDDPARMLGDVMQSAVAILTSDDLSRVRECAADTCGWLFLDRSRNHTRRWCDMKVCGNRQKVRRFYARQRRPS